MIGQDFNNGGQTAANTRRREMSMDIDFDPSFTSSRFGARGFGNSRGWIRSLATINDRGSQGLKDAFDAVNCLEFRGSLAKKIASLVRTREMDMSSHRNYSWLQNWIVDLWGEDESIKIALILLEGYLSIQFDRVVVIEDNSIRPLAFAILLASLNPNSDFDNDLSRLIFKRFDELDKSDHYGGEKFIPFLAEFLPVMEKCFVPFAAKLLLAISQPNYQDNDWSAAKRLLVFMKKHLQSAIDYYRFCPGLVDVCFVPVWRKHMVAAYKAHRKRSAYPHDPSGLWLDWAAHKEFIGAAGGCD